MVTDLDIYLFDLRGYLVIENALGADHLREANCVLDELRQLKPGEWSGHVHGHVFSSEKEGLNLQQIYEAGEPFEHFIDHPAWIEHVKTFVGGQNTFDCHHGPLFIDENFASIRGPGEAIFIHSGPVPWLKRCQFHVRDQQFNCGQINVLIALSDIGPGDGATIVVPGSHKSNFRHPEVERIKSSSRTGTVDSVSASVEVHLRAGDALLFVDAICHGSVERMNAGERRNVVYRYGPSWGFFRHGYRPSKALLERLTVERRRIVWPHERIAGAPGDE